MEKMIKRLVLGVALWVVTVSYFSQGAWGQGTQPQSSSAPEAAQTQDQQARPEPAPAPSTDEKKKASSSATAEQSSTVGDSATSGPLNVKGKLRYFAVESFRPGIY